jgi:hypothetical protein
MLWRRTRGGRKMKPKEDNPYQNGCNENVDSFNPIKEVFIKTKNKIRGQLFKFSQEEEKQDNFTPIIPICVEDVYNDMSFIHANSSWGENVDWGKRFQVYCKLLRNNNKKINILYIRRQGYLLVTNLIKANLEDLAKALDLEIEFQLFNRYL